MQDSGKCGLVTGNRDLTLGRRSLLTRGIELLEVGSQVPNPLLVLEAGIDHLGAWHLRLGILDVFGKYSFIPGYA